MARQPTDSPNQDCHPLNDSVFNFAIGRDQFGIEIAKNGFPRPQGEVQARRTSKRLKVAIVFFRPVRLQYGEKLTLASGPTQEE